MESHETTFAPEPMSSTDQPSTLADMLASVPDVRSELPVRPAISCPGCGRGWDGPLPERASADAFCPNCDYPMFLKSRRPAPNIDPSLEAAQRRSPGVAGREPLGVIACPRCGESNPPNEDGSCLRCGDPLVLPPPTPEPPPPPEPQIVYVTHTDHRWRTAALVLAGLLLVTLVVGALIWNAN